MFGRKKEEPEAVTPVADDTPDLGQPVPAKPKLPTAATAAPVGRPALSHPQASRRAPDMPAPVGRRSPSAPAEGKMLIVGRDIALSGAISACDRLIVEGRVEANLADCREMEIAESGTFKGKAEIDVADISGTFEGELTVRELLTIRATGRVIGRIVFHQLEVERGGEIVGEIGILDGMRSRPAAEPRNETPVAAK